MKKRQALKILKNHTRGCYTYGQLHAAFHTLTSRPNDHGVRMRGKITEQTFRNMVWLIYRPCKELTEELQLNYGQSNMELVS